MHLSMSRVADLQTSREAWFSGKSGSSLGNLLLCLSSRAASFLCVVSRGSVDCVENNITNLMYVARDMTPNSLSPLH